MSTFVTNAQWTNSGTSLFTTIDDVGIGTASPSARLHIVSDPGTPFGPSASIRLDDSDATPDKRIDFYEGATSVGYLSHTFNTMFLENDDAGGSIVIDAESDIIFHNSDVLSMILKNDGKLGIGTATPSDALEVNGAINLNSGFNTAMKVDGDEAIWYDGDHFSWGFDGNWNFFRDNINIGNSSTAPTSDQAILINNGKNIEFGHSPGSNPEVRWLGTGGSETAFIRLQSSTGQLDIESNTSYVELDGFDGIDFNTKDVLRMRLDETGNLGIGTSAPAYKLHVVGDACVTGELDVASDARLKKNVVAIEKAMDVVKKLAPKVYNFRQSEFPEMDLADGRNMGFLAQDLEDVLPELVSEGAEVVNVKDGNTFHSKSVNYIELIPLLTKAMQEQQETIDRLEAEISSIKKQLPNIE